MEHKDVEAEIVKVCEKCGFSGSNVQHSVEHLPELRSRCGYYRLLRGEALRFSCARCGYGWEIEVT